MVSHFHFFTKLASQGLVLGVIFVTVSDFGPLFLVFENLGDGLEI